MIISTKTEEHNNQIKNYWKNFQAEKEIIYKKKIIHGCLFVIFIFSLPYIFLLTLATLMGKI